MKFLLKCTYSKPPLPWNIYVSTSVKCIIYCCFWYAGNWELVKSIVGTKFRRSHICLHSHAGNRLWELMAPLFSEAATRGQAEAFLKITSWPMLLSFLLCYDNFCTKTDTSDKIKYSRIPKNTETQQENTKENTKKTTEINWDWSKKISWLVLVKTCKMSLLLISRF